MSISDLDSSFLKVCYPNLSKETYSWPLSFELENSADASYDLSEEATETANPENTNSRLGKCDKRRGDEAEQKTFRMMRAMLNWKQIPSFIITSYKWMDLLGDLSNICSKDTFKEGEIDCLVLLPTIGVFAIEVKAKATIKDENSARCINKRCFEKQIKNAIQVVAHSTSDFIARKEVVFVKIASLPNCPRSQFKRFTCKRCNLHFITKDDLESTDTLWKWYKGLTASLTKWELDFEMYGRMVCRLIGPQSRVQIKLISDVTNDIYEQLAEQGPDESGKSKWVQLNKTQWDTVSENPKFLWITGDPGTGKTVLARWKLRDILVTRPTLPKKHVVYFLPGNEHMLFIEEMKTAFGSYLKNTKNVELKIEPLENIFVKPSERDGLKGVLNVVERLQSNHKGHFLSIIIDEFWTIKSNGYNEEQILKVDSALVQNVWVIQNPACKEHPDPSDFKNFSFKKIKLKRVMRLSKSNLEFLKCWLSRDYTDGHAFQGPLPILYKMECICEKLQCKEETCTPFLIRKLTEEYIRNYQKTWPEQNEKINISEDIVILTDMHVKVKKLLMKNKVPVTVRPALYFTGCEKKVTIVDVRKVGGTVEYEGNIEEALTRAMGSLVLLEVSCKNDNLSDKIETHIQKLEECRKLGLIEIKLDISFSEAEIKTLLQEIRLGLYRDEHKFQENIGTGVTGEMLLNAIAPLKYDIRNINKKFETLEENISQKFDTLEANITQQNEKVDEYMRKNNEMLMKLSSGSTNGTLTINTLPPQV